ncbi:MAG: leucine--tRNA ligase [Candidatus Levybacteria bacterium RIFCSPHIGHO2_01_FULL_38_26]|nr:MAG: leucine--tRNA ligase [Candidatus Levybacteria bacterium RIFCSPHIGHO2_01_FULL_38_26]
MKTSKNNKKYENYSPASIEQEVQAFWEKNKVYSPNLDKSGKPFYNLMMFPYPSAEGMHVGNMYAFTGADVFGRFMRMRGFDVFEPMGLDGFGIHSENYAIKVGHHPKKQAKISQENFYKQLRATGNGFDWPRKLETYDPKYYKWTQWLFIQLFKAGLAYRKKAPVNFCPSCKTVLADEQVIDGKCERCASVVEKRELEQWFFRITKYADRLLKNIEKLDWSEKVKIAQRQWIGKSEGARIKFMLVVPNQPDVHSVEVFTTRPDTLYGATFLAVSPELGSKWINVGWQASLEVKKYIKEALGKRSKKKLEDQDEKTGVFSQIYAVNPLNNEKIPVWITDYVLAEYGTGALFGDAHDQRDTEFANKYGIRLKPTIVTGDKQKDERIKNLKECFTGYGTLIDSGPFSGLSSKEAMHEVVEWLKEHESGDFETTYHLRDWLISRQRYWGPPIPMIYCEKCKWQAVEEKDLPVLLPDVSDWKPLGTGKSPLANHPEFYKTTCPNCGGEARRETDVSDTFLDSAWYFFRYTSTDIESDAFDIERVKKWLPVNMYIGGAEHSVLHLLYSRFITMVLHDLKYIDFEEPFSRFFAHGLLIKEGAKMSKSKGNVVVPDDYIRKFGADTLRLYLMFLGPFNQGGDFYDTALEGMYRFVRRVWTLLTKDQKSILRQSSGQEIKNQKLDGERRKFMHKTIKKVSEDIEALRHNTAIAGLMEYYNYLNSEVRSKNVELTKEEMVTFIKLLAPFAPHITEELYQNVILRAKSEGPKEILRYAQNDKGWSVHLQPWPKFDPKFLEEDETTIVVQVNGRVRETLKVQSSPRLNRDKVQSYIEELAKESKKVRKHLEGKEIKRVVYVEGKIINFVTS